MAMRRLIEAVLRDHKEWKGNRNTFPADANAILEAVVLEFEAEAILAAVKKHFNDSASYRSVLRQLRLKAEERKARRIAGRKPAPDERMPTNQ